MSKIVNRTIDFFEAFAEQRRPLSLTELVKVLGIPLSSCHDVIHALEDRGYVYELKQRAGYYPTGRLYALAKTIVDNDPVTQRAMPVLDKLSESLQASVSLAKGKGDNVTYLLVSLPQDPLRFTVTVGAQARNLYATSVGKAYLASLPGADQKRLIAAMTLEPLTPATITSKSKLVEELKIGEQRGYFINREESVEDALTLSACFHWSGATYVITIAATLKRMEKQFAFATESLLRASKELSRND